MSTLTKQQKKDIARQLSTHDLSTILREKKDVISVQLWQKDDIIAALLNHNYRPTQERIDKISNAAANVLDDCSDNWEKLDTIIFDEIEEDSDISDE